MTTKQERVEKANALLLVISSHGRRFFYNPANDRVARFELGPSGHVFYIDDYSAKRLFISRNRRWRGFTHGGTLRDLVNMIANYIRTGIQLSHYWIGPQRSFDRSNIWGYEPAAMTTTREQAVLTGVVLAPIENEEGNP